MLLKLQVVFRVCLNLKYSRQRLGLLYSMTVRGNVPFCGQVQKKSIALANASNRLHDLAKNYWQGIWNDVAIVCDIAATTVQNHSNRSTPPVEHERKVTCSSQLRSTMNKSSRDSPMRSGKTWQINQLTNDYEKSILDPRRIGYVVHASFNCV